MAASEAERGPGKRGRNRARWQRHVAAQPHSGLSAAAYCRRHGLNTKCFYRWRRIFGDVARESGITEAPNSEGAQSLFAEVRVSGAIPASSGVEVCLAGGRVVRVTAGFDAPTLCRVVAALEGSDAC